MLTNSEKVGGGDYITSDNRDGSGEYYGKRSKLGIERQYHTLSFTQVIQKEK